MVQAPQIVKRFGFKTRARQQHDHAERAHGCEHIGDDIEERRSPGVSRPGSIAVHHAREHAQKHKTHLRNGGVGEHALQILLRDSRHITHHQRSNREHQQHGLPVCPGTQHAFGQQAKGNGKSREFGRAGNEQRHGSGRALIHIGNPHVEGHGAELECKPRHDEHQAQRKHPGIDLTAHQTPGNFIDGKRSSATVDHGHAIEQETGRQRAQYKILDRGFAAQP